MPGYTERPAFLQFFQIILTAVVLTLVGYSLLEDFSWNRFVDDHKTVRTCTFLLFQVDKAAYNATVQETLDSVNTYPVPGPDPSDVHVKNDIELFKREIYRKGLQESASLVLMCITFILLILHLCAACCSSDYEYRTKWTAAVQGVILFLAGFAGIFLAISAYNFDEHYEKIGEKFKECRILRLCRHETNNNSFHQFLKENEQLNKNLTRDTFRNVFDDNNVCQHFYMKVGAGIICGVVVVVGCIIICSAMDLTTIYADEDVDEEERARRDAYHDRHLKIARTSKTKALETKARLSIVSLIARPSMAVLPKLRLSTQLPSLLGPSLEPKQLPDAVVEMEPQPPGPSVDPHHKHHRKSVKI